MSRVAPIDHVTRATRASGDGVTSSAAPPSGEMSRSESSERCLAVQRVSGHYRQPSPPGQTDHSTGSENCIQTSVMAARLKLRCEELMNSDPPISQRFHYKAAAGFLSTIPNNHSSVRRIELCTKSSELWPAFINRESHTASQFAGEIKEQMSENIPR